VGNGQCAPYIEGELELPPCRTCAYGLAFKIWRENEYVNLRISILRREVRRSTCEFIDVENDREEGLSSAERRKNPRQPSESVRRHRDVFDEI